MKSKMVGTLTLALAFAGAPRLALAQGAVGTLCGIDITHGPALTGAELFAQCARFGAAVKSLQTKPGYASSKAFKALPPGMQREALAQAKKSPAEAQREFDAAHAEVMADLAKLEKLINAAQAQAAAKQKTRNGGKKQ
jgi:hypothetical protein